MKDAKSTRSQIAEMDRRVNAHTDEWDVCKVADVIKDVFDIDIYEISKRGEGTQAGLYDLEVKQAVAHSFGLSVHSAAFRKQIEAMEKIDVLAICLQQRKITGLAIRHAVNQIFGINLDGIATLRGAGISIYSKGQWIIRDENDLIVVKTSADDSSLEVCPASIYRSNSRLRRSIDRLHDSLTRLGFTRQEPSGNYVYVDPKRQSVPDSFKKELFTLLKDNITEALEGDI